MNAETKFNARFVLPTKDTRATLTIEKNVLVTLWVENYSTQHRKGMASNFIEDLMRNVKPN